MKNYLEDMGSVSADSFVIGKMSYKVVVIPPSSTWRPKTFELLKQFSSNGGKIVILGKVPTEIDCCDAEKQWMELAEGPNVWTAACGKREVQELIEKVAPQSVTIKDKDGCFVPETYLQRRIDGDQEIIFIVNSDKTSSRDYTVTFPGARGQHLTKWDAVKGECKFVQSHIIGDDLRAQISLPPCGSILLTLGGNEVAYEQNEYYKHHDPARIDIYDSNFDFRRSEDNALAIDRMSVSYDGGKTFEAEDYDFRIRQSIAERFGTSPALEWQPWVAIRKGLFDGRGGDIVLRYKFSSDLDKPKSFAVIEDIHKGQLTVNGEPVDISDASWQWDHAFGKVEITHLVKKGENTMDFAVHFDFLTEVEAAYIVGDFGVSMAGSSRGKITEEPCKLSAGTWTDQGYPFYSGRMIYTTEFEWHGFGHSLLRLNNPSGTLFKVKVNGEDAGNILWRPYELDLAPFVRPGKNTLEIEVVSSLQNLWGPLHEAIGDDNQWCDPTAFENDALLREDFSIYPYGLLGGIEIITF